MANENVIRQRIELPDQLRVFNTIYNASISVYLLGLSIK